MKGTRGNFNKMIVLRRDEARGCFVKQGEECYYGEEHEDLSLLQGQGHGKQEEKWPVPRDDMVRRMLALSVQALLPWWTICCSLTCVILRELHRCRILLQ